MSASLAVQQALRAALVAAPGLAGLTGVFDGVPVNAQPPYLTLGPDVVTDWSHKSGIGHEHRIQLGLWDDATGSARVKTLCGAAEDAVRALTGTLPEAGAGTGAGHRIASVQFLRGFVLKDPDGWTQGIVEFRIRTEQL